MIATCTYLNLPQKRDGNIQCWTQTGYRRGCRYGVLANFQSPHGNVEDSADRLSLVGP